MKKLVSVLAALLIIFSSAVTVFSTDGKIKKPFENSEFFESDGYSIHYRTYVPDGKPKGQIMMLHGFALSTASLEGIAEEYRKCGYTAVTADLPNFGYSTRETPKTDTVDREELIFKLMQSFGGKWILSGHSMGGGVAVNIAADHPEAVSGLILFAPQTAMKMSDISKKLMESLPARMLYDAVAKLAVLFPCLVRPLIAESFSDFSYSLTYDVKRITDPLKLPDSGTGVAMMAVNARDTDLEKVSQLDMPIVVVTAKNDRIADRTRLSELINAMPNARVVTVDKGGHMMMEYDPKLVCELTLF